MCDDQFNLANQQHVTGCHILFSCMSDMSTPILIGVGALAAAVAGRALVRRGFLAGKGASEQWVKGGFKSKMDRKEALAILGLKYAPPLLHKFHTDEV